MSDYAIGTDSSCDMTAEMAAELDVAVFPLALTIKGKDYFNYLDERDISYKEFYSILRSGEAGKTSAVSVGSFIDGMEPLLEAGKDILYLAFSSALSNTCSAGLLAAKELADKYPDRKIYVVDTLCASLGQGLLIYLSAAEKRKGGSIEEVRDWAEEYKLRVCHWFTVDDLNHLKRGGRLPAATALVGTLLGIKPVLHVDETGHLVNVGKARGRAASLDALADKMAETAASPEGQAVFISHADSREDAEKLERIVRERFGVKEVYINFIGPVIGAHAGPGTIALFFLGGRR